MKNNGVDPTRTSKKDQWSPVGSEWKSWYPLRNPGTAAPHPLTLWQWAPYCYGHELTPFSTGRKPGSSETTG